MRIVITIFAIISVLYTGYKVYDLYDYNQSQRSEHISYGTQSSLEVTRHMDSILSKVMQETEAFANALTEGSLAYDEILNQLKVVSRGNPNIMGMLAAFEPYQYDKGKKLFAPFFVQVDNDFIYIEDYYDYTDPNLAKAEWYVGVRDHGKQWTEPSFAGAAQRLVADYGVPFYKVDSKTGEKIIAGTITATITLKSLNNLLNSLSLGNTGYAYALSKKGAYLSHPNNDYLKQGRTIFEVAEDHGDPVFMEIANQIIKGNEGHGTYTNTVTGQESWVFYSPIEKSGWRVGVVMIKDELLADKTIINKKKIEIALFAAFSILLLAIIFSGALKGKEDAMWNLSMICAILILLNIGFIWFLEIRHGQRIHSNDNILIADYTGLNTFLSGAEEKAAAMNEAPIINIPTGVFIEEMEFINGYNVKVAGYVWQKYPDSIRGKVQEGFTFPQAAPDAELVYIEEAYRQEFKGYELVGWSFRVMFRLDFDYRIYPFDRREINLQIRPVDFSQNILLTPDFTAYKTIIPSSMPGTLGKLVLPGWEMKASYFDYRLQDYNANFGYEDFSRQDNVPEFHYNLLLKRHILSPFISTVIPIMVVAIMLFGVVYSTTKNRKKNVLAGFSAFGVVQTCAAFFFVIILAHIDLRQGMDTEEITYIEYFYFIMYLILLLVVFDVIIFSNTDKSTVFDYKDNLIMKLFYWPLLLGICLVITLMMFY